ncbi:MAG: adenosylcobinamide-GDP ribazoletransferase [Candidatus Bathyarchaeia archaeon]
MLREIKNLIAFLTIIPVGMDQNCVIDAAKYMYLFPLVGAFIGLLAGAFAWLLNIFLDPLLTGILTMGFILLITGLHHADGLLDFGDGLMYHGSAEDKIRVMHDQQTGVGGFTLGFIIFLATTICIAKLNQSLVIQSLTASESLAKLAMVIMAWLGKSAHEGMNTYFIQAMHSRHRSLRLMAALLITFCITLSLLNIMGFAATTTSIIMALLLTKISNRHFRGVTGDVFGAGNEIARLSSLLTILVMSKCM